ncbi:MAG: pyrroline-5-carboxylate reductase [Actinomycetota bacterium]|nr:pyrroline-5-carboxylate reductase [Actinomycetota bacterium]
MVELLLVGCGKMGRALLDGVIASGAVEASEIAVVEPSPAARDSLAVAYPGVALADGPLAAKTCIVATKPAQVPQVVRSLSLEPPALLISIAAGVPTSKLEDALAAPKAVVRAMPNTPGQIGMGVTAVCAGSHAGQADLEEASRLLRGLGEVVTVPENQMDAITAISGSGPAYLYYIVEALVDSGIELGLSADLAAKLAVATFAGSTELLARRKYETRALRLEVSSPGGTTIAATNAFDVAGVRAGIRAGVRACYERSVELGKA